MNRDVVQLSDEQLKELFALKKNGFSKTEVEGKGYFVERTNSLTLHELTKEHRKMSEEEYRSLVESIALNGQITPVVLYRGKIVDGRHRYYALQDLGIDYIKYTKLPNNLTMKEVEEIVKATEVRRHDSPIQKAAKAYLESRRNDITVKDAANKFGVSIGSISKMKVIADRLGSDIPEVLYNKGEVWIDNKRYTSLSMLYNLARKVNHEEPSEIDDKGFKVSNYSMSDLERAVKEGDLVLLAAFKTWVTNQIDRLNKE